MKKDRVTGEWGRIMEIAAGLVELLYLLTLLWVAISGPLWVVLAGCTWYGSRRSRAARALSDGSGSVTPPQATRLGHATMITAFAVAASSLLTVGLFAAAFTFGDQDSVGWLFWSGAVLVALVDVAGVFLTALFVAVMRDVFTEGRVAGRETLVAYSAVTTLYVAMLVGSVVVGAYSNLIA